MRHLAFLALALASGCSLSSDSGDLDFGDAYTVSESAPISVSGDSLRVTVSYGGGCAAHTFELRSREADSREVWLVHDANGDTCEALLTERLAFPIAARPGVLITPAGQRRSVD